MHYNVGVGFLYLTERNMKIIIARVFQILVVLFALSGTAAHGADLAIPIAQGWNLLGNTSTAAIDVASLGDVTKVTTVWKWNSPTASWAFYAPKLAADATLATYASGKGYQVLASIAPGEGFWLNAAQAFTLSRPGIFPYSLGSSSLVQGWNLLATGDALSPAQLDAKLGGVAGSPSFSTMWAWNSASSNWYFYAPALAATSGLTSYIQTKGYLDFGPLTTDGGLGFWLNSNVSGTSSTAPTVVPVTDNTRTVSQTMTAAGGTLSVTAADGSVMTLTIPAKALVSDVGISMTPLSSVGGMPLSGGLIAGVDLQPSGLAFAVPVTLTIQPANPGPIGNQVPFGYHDAGAEFHLEPPMVSASAITLKLLSFSAGGVASGTSSEVTAQSARTLASASDTLANTLSPLLSASRQAALNSQPDPVLPGQLQSLIDQWVKESVLPKIKAASSSCAAAKEAQQYVLSLERHYQLLGLSVPKIAGLEDAQVSSLMATVDAACLQEAFQECTATGNVPKFFRAILAIEGRKQIEGVSDGTGPMAGEDLFAKCNRWTVDISSNTTQTAKATFRQVMKANGIVFQGGVPGTAPTPGTGALDYYTCDAVNLPADALFLCPSPQGSVASVVVDFDYNAKRVPLGQSDPVPDIRLGFGPGTPNENATLIALITINNVVIQVPTKYIQGWPVTFQASHTDEFGTWFGGSITGFLIRGFSPANGSKQFTKTVSRTDIFSGAATETTVITITHAPLP